MAEMAPTPKSSRVRWKLLSLFCLIFVKSDWQSGTVRTDVAN